MPPDPLFQPDLEPRRRPTPRRPRRSWPLKLAALVALVLAFRMTGPDRGAAHAATLAPRAAVPVRALRILESAPARAAAEKTAHLAARRTVKGKHWVQVWATAYCPTCKICETGRRTATGRHAFTHGVAVSAHGKRAVALGARVYIPRFGWLPVDDTGGKVRGDQIDIRMATHQHAKQWGRRLVRICLDRS